MADRLTKEKRSWLMSRVRGKDTTPELLVRSFLHGLGFRYRLHVKNLSGSPDLVFVSRRKIIFVHGCFWHGHTNCTKAKLPKSNVNFWRKKIRANQARDKKSTAVLKAAGWDVKTVWQCELKRGPKAFLNLVKFLEK